MSKITFSIRQKQIWARTSYRNVVKATGVRAFSRVLLPVKHLCFEHTNWFVWKTMAANQEKHVLLWTKKVQDFLEISTFLLIQAFRNIYEWQVMSRKLKIRVCVKWKTKLMERSISRKKLYNQKEARLRNNAKKSGSYRFHKRKFLKIKYTKPYAEKTKIPIN